MELLCEGHRCAVDETATNELASGFDTGQYSWRPANPGTQLLRPNSLSRGMNFNLDSLF